MSMQTLLCRELSSSYEGEHLLFGLTARYEELTNENAHVESWYANELWL